MNAYEFAFVVEDFDIDDDDSLVVLYEYFEDVDASLSAGRTTLEFVVEADGAWDALRSTLRKMHEFFPDVHVVRIDRDLVSMADIAARCGRSAESVRLLSLGQRGPGVFPSPVGVLGGGTRVWEWAAVATWFRKNLQELTGEPELIDAECAALFDAHLTTHGRSVASKVLRPIEPSKWGALLDKPARAWFVDPTVVHGLSVIGRAPGAHSGKHYFGMLSTRIGEQTTLASHEPAADPPAPAGVFIR